MPHLSHWGDQRRCADPGRPAAPPSLEPDRRKNTDDGRQPGGGSFKVGGLHGQRFKIRRDAMDKIIDLLMFYKHRQRHSSLGCVSPMQFERDWLPPRTGRLRNGPNYGLRKPQEGRALSGSTIRARCGAALT